MSKMLRLLVVSITVLASFAAAVPTNPVTQRASKPELIRSVSSPIFHFYLQAHPKQKDIPVMGPEKSGDTYNIATTIQSTNTSQYLNIIPASTSYKPLAFGATSNTTAWGLEGDTIITTTGSSFGRQLNFLACDMSDGYWQLYLQTGSDTPSGKKCSNYQTLHLPCLC